MKTKKSRRFAESRPVCLDLNTPFIFVGATEHFIRAQLAGILILVRSWTIQRHAFGIWIVYGDALLFYMENHFVK